jgi:hypothetical protein
MNTKNALIQITILNSCIVAQSKLKTGNQNMRKRLTHSIRNLFPNFVKTLQTEFQVRSMVTEQCEFKS